MTFDLIRVLECKRKLRRHLASQPLAEKLAMLDALRERALMLRGASASGSVQEGPAEYCREASPRNTSDP